MKTKVITTIVLFVLSVTGKFYAVAPAPTKVDLRTNITNFNIPVKSQGSRNTCSVYASTFLLEYEAARASNQKGIDYSEDYLNAVTDIVKGSKDDGDFFNNVLNGYLKFGTVDESDFPTDTKSYDPNKLPSDSLLNDGKANVKYVPVFIKSIPATGEPWGLSDENIAQIIAQLDAGRPVAAGWRLAKGGTIENSKVLGVDAWSKNVMKTPLDFVGHSMAIVGYAKGTPSEGGYFIIRNSGGADWGDKGYWYCTFDFAKQNIADVFYFKPKPRDLRVQLPRPIYQPVPHYIHLNTLRQIPLRTKTNVIILQKPGS
ncbi:MAG TPA: C1 family peptidase [Pyrinomonadaceae bacterium]|nr:C1 family peptidase [Pyrinomonadaceae bacterium]